MDVNTVSVAIDVATILLFGLIWFGILTFLRLKEKQSFVYLLFFTIFYVYLLEVLNITEFQFQSLLLLDYLSPGHLMLRGVGDNLNLIPLITLTLKDLETSLLNVLMLMPFGFGLPFITNFRMRKVVVIGALFSFGIELLQLITGLLGKSTFRIADINDVIFNTVGVAIGYIVFAGFIRIYRRAYHNWGMAANPVLRYIAFRPQVDKRSVMKSKTIITTTIAIIVVAAAAFYGHTVYQKGHPQVDIGTGAGGNEEGAVPQSGDLCGGTGGTGEIISTGDSTIVIQRKDGVVQTITLTPQTNIRNSAGPISESDLKVGDHVTLVVPSANKTASDVLLCNITGPETQSGQ